MLTKGPIFTQLLLADEINRTPPKTQAALLQAMNERAVTIDGQDHALGDDFMVVATQNPIEQQGTYPLPEAQLDRFLFKIIIDYPSRDEEREIVRRHGHRSAMPRLEDFGLQPVADAATLAAVREAVDARRASPTSSSTTSSTWCAATREHSSLEFGASTAGRQHAGGRGARVRGAAGPRFRHPRRRQGAGPAGAAPPRRPVARAPRSRGSPPTGSCARSSTRRRRRADACHATDRRAVLIFAAGIPLALLVVHLRSEPVGAVVQLRHAGRAGARHRRAAGVPAAAARRQGRDARQALYRRARARSR